MHSTDTGQPRRQLLLSRPDVTPDPLDDVDPVLCERGGQFIQHRGRPGFELPVEVFEFLERQVEGLDDVQESYFRFALVVRSSQRAGGFDRSTILIR